MKLAPILMAAAILILSGCAALQGAGHASYAVRPFVIDETTGKTACCLVSIEDGKERASLTLDIVKVGENYSFRLDERGVQAFAGQAIAAGATRDALDAAVKAAVGAALVPLLPALAPAAGAALVGKTP